MAEVNFCYEGKNFVVVGASSGIGKQIAMELSQAGANVLCIARRTELIEQMKIHEATGEIIPGYADVTKANPSDWDKIFEEFTAKFGKLNGGVYTAGVVGLTSLRAWDDRLAKNIADTSYLGMLNFMRSVTKKRFVVDGSSFVVFSSVAAHTGYKGLLIYSSIKAAVQTAVKSMAKELAKQKHRVNSVSPGWLTDTEMTSVEKDGFSNREILASNIMLGAGSTDKISGVVLFLLSDRADWITGVDILVDGGMKLGGVFE